jgi:uncharacterized protein (DUF58 family)
LSNRTAAFLDADFLKKLENLSLISKKIRRGRLRGEHSAYRRGASLDWSDYRSYQPGDDFRSIDWNIYSRLGKIFVKLYTAEEDLTVYLLIDSSASMDTGSPNKLRYGIRIAAALGYIGVLGLDRVGAFSFSDTVKAVLPPLRRKEHIFQLFDFLERIEGGGGTNFPGVISRLTTMNLRPGLVILISDFFDKGEITRELRRLLFAGHDLILVQVHSDEEMDPDIKGPVSLEDIETGVRRKLFADRKTLGLYKTELDHRFTGLEKFALDSRIEYMIAGTSLPLEQLVFRYLRQGIHLR